MFPGVYNITFVRDTTTDIIAIQCLGNNNVPFNLTNFTPRAQVRVQPEETVILDLLPEISDAASGLIEIPSFTAAQTSVLPLGVYHWDLILIDVFNDIFPPFLIGQFYIVDKTTVPIAVT